MYPSFNFFIVECIKDEKTFYTIVSKDDYESYIKSDTSIKRKVVGYAVNYEKALALADVYQNATIENRVRYYLTKYVKCFKNVKNMDFSMEVSRIHL